MADRETSAKSPRSMAAFLSGVLAVLVFFVGGFLADLWPVGMVIGAVAVVLGLVARRKAPGDRLATLGVALGAFVVVFGLAWIVLASLGVIPSD
jgi:uncharacterized membrane protein HdeD (DUF308 family)